MVITIFLLSVNCVAFHSYEFRKGVIIVTGVKDSEPEFAQIDKLFVLEGKVVLLLDIWETQYFYRHYHAYAVLPSTEQKVMEFDKVRSQRPLHVSKSNKVGDNLYYIITRSNNFS